MSHGIQDCRRTPKELQPLYAPIQRELAQVEEVLRDELSSQYPFVDRLAKHGFRLGGKRLRPALVLLSATASGQVQQSHFSLAAAVEMIHTATLIHDDVLDEATMRRHLETVNALWDNEASVLLGDYLFSLSIQLVSSVDSTFASQCLGRAAKAMCEGELRQVASRGNFELTEEEYLEIIADKTAALCACCCELGAHFAGAKADVTNALTQYGHHLGVAFQIADDILDVQGDEAKTGKSLGTDVLKQKATLPLIRLLNQVDKSQRAELVAMLTEPSPSIRDTLRCWLQRNDAIGYAQQKATCCVRRAKDALNILPESPARDCLRQLADFVIARQQ
jgi:octaprenyl-diphosphate synthase